MPSRNKVSVAVPLQFEKALALYQGGKYSAAQHACKSILRQIPRHPETLHLLGVLACLNAEFDEANEIFGLALSINPNHGQLHAIRGDTLQQLGRHREAITSYDRTIALQPDSVEAYSARAESLMAIGHYDQALDSCDQAIALRPTFAEAHANRGNALKALSRFDEAVKSYDRAINLKPDFAEAFSNRGLALHELHRYRDALSSYEAAIRLNPQLPQAYYNRGNALLELKQYEDAIESYNRAISIKPDYPEAYSNRGNALAVLDRFTDALTSYDQAIELADGYAEAFFNRGNVFRELDKYVDALSDYDRAIAINPQYAESHCNRGLVFLALKRYADALSDFRTAISLKPDFADVFWNQGTTLLTTGALEEGWAFYEWRKRLDKPYGTSTFWQPVWSGAEDISQKTLLVYHEQGLGDVIQFCRYVKLCGARAARVILSVPGRLVSLLKRLASNIEIVDAAEQPPNFDYQCALMSLPLVFGTTLDTIPVDPAYLTPDPECVTAWTERLGDRDKPRLGLAWSGNPRQQNDRYRSIPFGNMEPLLNLDVDWHALQTEVRDSDLGLLRRSSRLRLWNDEITGFANTAGLVQHLDLIVTVDTSIAHLAGAMGKPTWILLPYAADWRWLTERSDSPWYPSVRLWRQKTPGDWESLVGLIKTELELYFGVGVQKPTDTSTEACA